MLKAISWTSEEQAPRLTPQEVDVLFNFTYECSKIGELSNGKYVGASQPLYWQRLKGGN